MAFDSLKPRTVSIPQDRVCVGLISQSDGKQISLNISVGSLVREKLGWPIGARIKVDEGHGPDARVLRLTMVDTGHYKLISSVATQTSNVRVSTTAFQRHKFPAERNPSDEVPFQAFGGSLLVMLPDWAVPL